VSLGTCTRDLRPQFRLRPGQDDLLIEWLVSFAPRQRSQAIRDALRDYLSGQNQAVGAAGWDEDPELAATLDSLF
jgi:hypothetical protein